MTAGSEVEVVRINPGGPAAPDVVRLLARIAELEAEIAQLKDGLASRQQIGVITGLLAERLDLTPDRAWSFVVRLSTQTNLKAREVARILHTGYFGELGPEDREAASRLNEQLPDGSHIPLDAPVPAEALRPR